MISSTIGIFQADKMDYYALRALRR